MKVFIATKNQKKLGELERILKPMGFEVFSERDFPEKFEEVEETGETFEENALIKARAVCKALSSPAIADDSGIEVYALDMELAARMQLAQQIESLCDISDAIENIADKMQIMLITRKA